MLHRRLQARHVVGKSRQLGDRIGKFKDRHAVAGPHDPSDETRGRPGLKVHFLEFTEARVDHERQIERLLGLGLENLDLLGLAFFVHFELVAREVGRRAALLVQHAGQDVDQIHIHANLAPLI